MKNLTNMKATSFNLRAWARLLGVLTTLASPAVIASNVTNTTTNPGGVGSMLVGTARVDISPALNPYWLPLDEYELEHLYLRVILVQSNGEYAALIGTDLANIEELVFQHATGLVAEYLNTTVANVVMSCTHTHGAAQWGSGLFFTAHNYGNEELGSWDSLGEAALAAVQEASSNMVPASMGHGTGESYLNVNRDHLNPLTGRWTQDSNFSASAPVDREVQALTFVNGNGTPIAVYTTYAMHPVNSYLAGYTSADWPGAMSRWIELAFEDHVVAINSQSPSGDINPRSRRPGTNNLASISHVPITGLVVPQEPIEEPIRNYMTPLMRPDVKVTRQLFDQVTALGITVGEEVIRIMSDIKQWDANPVIWGKQQNISCPGRIHIDSAREGVPGIYTDGPDISIKTGALGLGDLVLATIGGEIFTRIGWSIMEQTPMPNKTMIVTMANGWSESGYMPDTLSWDQEVFQVLGSKLYPGSCAQTSISSMLATLIKEYQTYLASSSLL